MKLGCSSSSYHAAFRAGRIDQREWVRICAEQLEVDGVELVDVHFPTTDRNYLRELKRQCVDLGLTIAGLAVTNDFGPDDRRAQEIEKVRQWTDVATFIGAPIVRVFSGTPAVSPPLVPEAEEGRIVGAFRKVFGPTQPNVRRTWSDAAYALRQCADYAGEHVVVLALQNAPRAMVSTQAELTQCLHDVGSPWLRVSLDPSLLPGRVESPLPGVVQVRARVTDVREDGADPTTPWRHLLHELSLVNFRGFVLADYQGTDEPETAVPRLVRYLRGAQQSVDAMPRSAAAPDTNGAGDATSIGEGATSPREAEEPR